MVPLINSRTLETEESVHLPVGIVKRQAFAAEVQ